jgi:hypothetical protein
MQTKEMKEKLQKVNLEKVIIKVITKLVMARQRPFLVSNRF